MKGSLKRPIIILLCLMVLLTCVSCETPETETVVMQCNGIDITESIYKMYLYEAGSELKSQHIPQYTDEEYDALTQEEKDAYYQLLDHFWDTKIDGKMPFDIVRENALQNLKIYAFYAKECKDNNVAMTEEELRSFTAQMELYYQDSLDKIEGWFGVTKEQYFSYLAQMDVFASYVDIQASGISVSQKEIEERFNEYRQTYGKVVVQTIFLQVTEEQDDATQKALADDIKNKIENGESFTELVAAYSDYKKYEDGSMIVTKESTLDKDLGKGFVKHVLASSEKDLAVLKTDLGYCVINTIQVSMTDNASGELKVIIQDEKYINRVKSVVNGNADYDLVIVNQECYDAICDVPAILK